MRTFILGTILAFCFILPINTCYASNSDIPDYVIAGRITDTKGIPLKNVVIDGLPGNPLTDQDGYYADSIPQGWSGTITPLKKGFVFFPVSRVYTDVQRDTTNLDFVKVITHPVIHVTPDSVVLSQVVISSVIKHDNVRIDTKKKNLTDLIYQADPESNFRSLGCLVPDSIVEYWKMHRTAPESKFRVYPLSIDWSNNDSPIKNQGACGSCWAFAATAFIENLGIRSDLSEQYIISCAGAGSCGGGYFDRALQFYKNNGVPDESYYPYTQTNGDCNNITTVPSYKERITFVSSTLWGIATVSNLKEQLQKGPLVVRMLVPTDNSFANYTSGVYHYPGVEIPESQGHAVLLVGYDDVLQCFKCKNSWGYNWGDGGYFRIAYDDVTNNVQFGSYAINGSGVYTEQRLNTSMSLSNRGVDDLLIDSISSKANWLSVLSVPEFPFIISPGYLQDIVLSVDWALVGTSTQYGELNIESNDPDQPSFIVKVTAIPLPCIQIPPTVGTVVQPTCTNGSGSVYLYNLPAGNWTLNGNPGGILINGTATNTTVSELAANTYTFNVTNDTGCTSANSSNVVIDSVPKPVNPIISYTDNVLLSNVVKGNQWYNQDGLINGASDKSYLVTTTGDYYDIVTLGDCSSEKSNIITAKYTGIYQANDHSNVQVYPNPITNEMMIEFKGNKESVGFEILNSIGKMIYRSSLIEKTVVKTSGFPSGIYLLKLLDKQYVILMKIIKKE